MCDPIQGRAAPVVAVCVLVFSTMSCGDDGAGVAAQPRVAGQQAVAPPAGVDASARDALSVGFALPRVIAVQVMMSRAMVVEAVYQATALSGGMLTGQVARTGTLRQGVAGFQYLPQPADRLVVVLGSQTHEFVVEDTQGNNGAPSSDIWLQSPHRLRYVHRIAGQAEARIEEVFDGSRFDVTVKGVQEREGRRFDVDLRTAGGASGRRDFQGQEVTTQAEMTGRITGGNVEVDVRETLRSNLVAANSPRLLYSQRGMASRIVTTSNSVVKSGSDTFQFQGVEVVTDVNERGGSGGMGVVSAQGVVLRGGSPFGNVVLQGERAVLRTAAESIALDGR
jgi:hypothetical protein